MEESVNGSKSEKIKQLEFDEDRKPVAAVSKAEQWVTTLVIYYCHLSLGVSASFLAPALISFAEQYRTGMQSMSLVITISRYLGLGSGLAFGYLFSFVNRHAVVTVLVFILSVVLFFMPYAGTIAYFGILFALMNIAASGYVTATSVWVLDIWKDQAGPYIQAQHFFYALGCIIPPTVFAPFLERLEVAAETRSSMNMTLLNSNVSSIDETTVDHMEGVYTPSLICTVIIGLGAILMLIIFFVFKKPTEYEIAKTDEEISEEKSQSKVPEVKDNSKRNRKFLVIGLSSVLLGAVQSMEMIVGSYLSAYAHYSGFAFTEAEGARLLSVFQLTFTLARLAGIFIILKFDPKLILVVNILLVAAGNVLLLLFSNSGAEPYLWIGTILMAIGFASSFPTVFGFLQAHLEISNLVGSILIVGGAAMASFFPMIVGAYIETSADVVTWLNLGTDIAAAGTFFAIIFLVKAQKEKL